MATLQVWDVRGRLDHSLNYAANPDKTDGRLYTSAELCGLKDVIDYASDDAKTSADDHQLFVSGINCVVATAREDMQRTKKQFMDTKEIIAFHAFQSFKPGELGPELAHKVGMQFAWQMWGEKFQVLVATHLNTGCIHNHFVINSTSFVDGKRFYDNKETLRKARQVSDEICKEHGLSVIEEKQGGNIPIALYKKEQAGMPTRYNIARAAIDEAIAAAFSMRDFEKQLRGMGYKFQFSESRKHWTITPKGWSKPIRLKQLGEEYSKENIAKRIEANTPEMVMEHFHSRHRPHFVNTRPSPHSASTLRGLYRHYCYLLGILPTQQKQNPASVHYLLRDDLLKMEYISREAKFLHEKSIDTKDQLAAHKAGALEEMDGLKKQRSHLWNSLRRVQEPVDEMAAKNEIAKISARLKQLREEVKMCEGVEGRMPTLEEKFREVYEEKVGVGLGKG